MNYIIKAPTKNIKVKGLTILAIKYNNKVNRSILKDMSLIYYF